MLLKMFYYVGRASPCCLQARYWLLIQPQASETLLINSLRKNWPQKTPAQHNPSPGYFLFWRPVPQCCLRAVIYYCFLLPFSYFVPLCYSTICSMPINSYITKQRSACNVLLILGYFITAYAHQLCSAAVLEFRVYSKILHKKNADNKSAERAGFI